MAASCHMMLLRSLDGHTLCLRFPSPLLPLHALKHRLAALLRVPARHQRIVTGTRDITSLDVVVAGPDGLFPPCSLLLRLPGGKGGFGSLLRGAATKAGQKKTSNFDACRDMSGRRLRHVNAERKLKEWKAEARERELEKAAQDFLKRHVERKEEESGVAKELDRYRQATSKAMEDVESAVEKGLLAAARLGADGKRKKAEAVLEASKKARLWVPFDDSDEECDDGPSGEERGDCSKGPCSESSPLASMSPDSEADMGNDVGDNRVLSSQKYDKNLSSNDLVSSSDEATGTEASDSKLTSDSGGGSGMETVQSYYVIPKDDMSEQFDQVPHTEDKSSAVSVTSSGNVKAFSDGSFGFDEFTKAEEMQVLGLDILKFELQSRGLKCGGSLAERAARLFMLKTTPLDKLDKKHFAKTK